MGKCPLSLSYNMDSALCRFLLHNPGLWTSADQDMLQ